MSDDPRQFPKVERIFQPYEDCSLCAESITGTGLLVIAPHNRQVVHDACIARIQDLAMETGKP